MTAKDLDQLIKQVAPNIPAAGTPRDGRQVLLDMLIDAAQARSFSKRKAQDHVGPTAPVGD